MNTIKQKTLEFIHGIELKRGKIVSIIFLVISVAFVYFGKIIYTGEFLGLIWNFGGLLIAILVFSMAIAASLVVIDSLFHIGTGLTLIIFLAQSYCGVSNYTVESDNSLKSLLIITLIYIGYDFVKTLYAGIKARFATIKTTKKGFEKFSTVILFLAFAFMFVVAVYRVVNPIITNFCVYHR